MKNAVTILSGMFLGAIILAIVITVSGRMNRSVEAESNLPAAVEGGMLHMMSGEGEEMRLVQETAAESMERLAMQLDTVSDVTAEIMKADAGKGVLAMRLTEEFRYPNGTYGKVSSERTAILNGTPEQEAARYEARFYRTKEEMLCEAQCYKIYKVYEGERLNEPAQPAAEDAAFLGWRDANDYMADFTQPIEQDVVYYAEWR